MDSVPAPSRIGRTPNIFRAYCTGFSLQNNVAFDGFKFFDIFGTIPDNLTAVLNPATNYAGFTAARLAGGDKDTLFVNVANLPGLQGQIISIDLVQPSAAVPEPASMLLLGTGVIGIGARRWRNRSQRG